jgi:hypothetical protein
MFEQSGPRMGISDYWLSFMACWGVTFAGVFGIVFASFIDSDFFMLISILALLGGSLYIRVAQMQRCNDIGWPWQTPWIVFGLGLAVSAIAQFAAILALLMLPLMPISPLVLWSDASLRGKAPSPNMIRRHTATPIATMALLTRA